MNRFSIFSICIILLLVFAGCSREKPRVAAPTANKDILAVTTTLATIADDERPPQVFPGHGAPDAQNQPDSFAVVFSESGRGVAYTVQKNNRFYVVHNSTRGKEHAFVGHVVLSPDGRRIAYAARADGKWRMVVDGREDRPYDVLLTPIFSPDGHHVVYQAKEGDKWYVVVDEMKNAGTIASYTTPEFSSDSKLIAYVEAAASNDEMKLIVSDLKFVKQHFKKSIGDLLFTTNKDRTRIAAEQVVNGKFRIIDFSFDNPDVVHEGPLYDLIEQLTLSDDGKSVSYCALKGRKRLLVLNDREEDLPKGILPQLPVVRPDRQGVGVLLCWQNRCYYHQSFINGKEREKKYDEAADLAYSKDSRYHTYAARKGKHWFVVVNGNEGRPFDRVVSPIFSPDGKRLVYRARKNGKRFVVVADTNGKTIKQHPPYEQVFQPVFTADGKSIAYGVKDGNKLIWKVEKMGK